jgi:hypothetical protein
MALPKISTATGLFKGIPHLVKPFLKPMLLISFGLHAAVLFMPLPSSLKKAETPKPKVIKLTKIPTIRIPPKPVAQQLNLKKPPTPNVPSPNSQQGLLPKKQPTKQTKLVVPGKSKKQQDTTASSPKGGNSDDVWSVLRYPYNEMPICHGVNECIETKDDFTKVTQYFDKKLAEKFKVSTEKTDNSAFDDLKYISYKIVNKKDGSTRYLNIFYNGETTIYALAPSIISKDEIIVAGNSDSDTISKVLEGLAALKNPEEEPIIVDKFPGFNEKPPNIKNTKYFFNNPTDVRLGYKKEVIGSPRLTSLSPENALSELSQQLTPLNYTLKPAGAYEDITLYEMIQLGKKMPTYLAIIPTAQRDGSIVVHLSKKPG